MDKISSRIWLLLAGIAVAIAIAISAVAMDRKVIPPQPSETPQKNKVSALPAIFIKTIYTIVESPVKK